MDEKYVDGFGSVKISEDVIATIVNVTANDVVGVAGITAKGATELKGLFPAKKTSFKGIKIDLDDDEIEVDVNVILKFGVKITEVVAALQTDIKHAIESMCGMKVKAINVYVSGISMVEEKPAAL